MIDCIIDKDEVPDSKPDFRKQWDNMIMVLLISNHVMFNSFLRIRNHINSVSQLGHSFYEFR